jgi:alpha-L-fucosidase 2
MFMIPRPLLALLVLLLPCVASGAQALKIWYDKPASKWTEALPVGNGRMAAMVFGGVEEERIQFNEETLWTGSPHSYAHPGAVKHLPEIRRLLFADKQQEAEELALREFMSVPLRQCSYQPFGDVRLTFPHKEVKNYRRELDLDTAVCTTRYEIDGVTFTREVFASYPDRVVVMRLSSSKPGKLDLGIGLTSPQPQAQPTSASAGTLTITGVTADFPQGDEQPPGPLKFLANLTVSETDGEVEIIGDALHVQNASHATLILSAATSFKSFREVTADAAARSRDVLQAVVKRSYAELHSRHIADHQSLFRRFTLDLGPAPEPDLPTDQRLVAAEKTSDPALAALFAQYGRYLMIASSRPGCQPANLQGKWNAELAPPWDSKYTININYQMNYWLTEPTNLTECGEPFFAVVSDLRQSGTEVAREHYGAPGWVVHHNFDLWRGAAPINASDHGIWPTGGAWICQHLWEHFLYTGDVEFLRTTAYPALKGAAEFAAYTLVEDPRDPQHSLVSGPSNSPEQGGLVMGPTMDHQILRELLANTANAAQVLGVDSEEQQHWRDVRARIAPLRVGQRGQLQEWLEDRPDPDPRHRHVSHLWGLYPGSEITPDTPKFFDAAQRSLELRGDGGTGWSIAWKINLWARLLDGDHAHKMLRTQLSLIDSPLTEYTGGGVYANLFDAHPPFQIDGNFGAASGVCEMLVQSHRTVNGVRLIELLPALPSAWPTGEVRGLRTRDGFTLDMRWAAGKLQECRVTSTLGKPARFRCGEHEEPLSIAKGTTVLLDGNCEVEKPLVR